MSKDTRSPAPMPIPKEREITLPPRDYQPTKAESNQEYGMPGADIMTVVAFFTARQGAEGNARDRLAGAAEQRKNRSPRNA